jgi:CRISPR-associated protein Csm4
MRLQYVVIEFETPFHVGRYSLMDALDYVPSDTVYSALEWLKRAGVRDVPARVSSAYPMLPAEGGRYDVETASGRYVLTAPVPALWRLALLGARPVRGVSAQLSEGLRKDVRELRFMPLECLRRGELEAREVGDGGGLVMRCGDVAAAWRPGFHGEIVVRAHNRISRNTSMADTFRIAAFSPRVPYVVYFQGGDARAFEVLGPLGLGGRRSWGLGRFRVVQRGEVELPDGGEWAVMFGVARPYNHAEALGAWEVRSWRCTRGVIGPVSVLLDGSVVRGDFELEVIERTDADCTKRLDPLWAWLS